MAKQPEKKKSKKKKKKARSTASDSVAGRAQTGLAQPQAAREPKIGKALKKAKSAASKLKENPLVSEVVAAALVATAAALKDPRKARRLAADAGEELERAQGKVSRKADAFWALALDVARRSLEALGADDETGALPKTSKRKK
ncbi:MAG: hypothetical protein ACLGHC_00035 [Alphaproteobacteria bacterium]